MILIRRLERCLKNSYYIFDRHPFGIAFLFVVLIPAAVLLAVFLAVMLAALLIGLLFGGI